MKAQLDTGTTPFTPAVSLVAALDTALGLLLEEGLWDAAGELDGLGLEIVRERNTFEFGGGQAIMVDGDALLGGSDPRKDGYAGAI